MTAEERGVEDIFGDKKKEQERIRSSVGFAGLNAYIRERSRELEGAAHRREREYSKDKSIQCR